MDIEGLRKLCLGFPGATEDIKWGNDLCFCIAGKMFCVCGIEPPLKVSLKVTEEEFHELTSAEDVVPAPYVARYHWILVEDNSRFSKKEWEVRIRKSYELVKAKIPKAKLRAAGIAT
jgi:predicted DNA-binding protein (MmcQ/YjbR family)